MVRHFVESEYHRRQLPAARRGPAGGQLLLPPGFRFYPSDEELVVHYLCRKAASEPFTVPIIAEIDLYKFDPWNLPEKALFGEKEWYFFSPRDRKYPNGSRPNRAAGSGYWKATGTDKPISIHGGKLKVGVKKALVFYSGKAPKGEKTNWIMHEYRLADSASRAARRKGSLRLDDWVLCRIYEKLPSALRLAAAAASSGSIMSKGDQQSCTSCEEPDVDEAADHDNQLVHTRDGLEENVLASIPEIGDDDRKLLSSLSTLTNNSMSYASKQLKNDQYQQMTRSGLVTGDDQHQERGFFHSNYFAHQLQYNNLQQYELSNANDQLIQRTVGNVHSRDQPPQQVMNLYGQTMQDVSYMNDPSVQAVMSINSKDSYNGKMGPHQQYEPSSRSNVMIKPTSNASLEQYYNPSQLNSSGAMLMNSTSCNVDQLDGHYRPSKRLSSDYNNSYQMFGSLLKNRNEAPAAHLSNNNSVMVGDREDMELTRNPNSLEALMADPSPPGNRAMKLAYPMPKNTIQQSSPLINVGDASNDCMDGASASGSSSVGRSEEPAGALDPARAERSVHRQNVPTPSPALSLDVGFGFEIGPLPSPLGSHFHQHHSFQRF